MNQEEKRLYLIKYLLSENNKYSDVDIPSNEDEQKRLLRSLFNVRLPAKIDEEFLKIQDEYLQEETRLKRITNIKDLEQNEEGIYLWQGDITTLKCDAIVNAANSGMTGCYIPCHNCIDNIIHTFAGIELRNDCNEIMMKQGHEEETGKAKITKAYNLPSKYIIHTVGTIVNGNVTNENQEELKSCYMSCLKIADENNLDNIAFCCISTGVFGFPNELAAEIAVNTVRDYKKDSKAKLEVIFNVFKECDYEIYKNLLGRH
ncbi:MAG: protein-ADP-ribose hydrolase [Lachnospiraceae bacterium]|nr:protein-ADP-ribose hydrolase [Lachnospiraceae bacterium]